MPLFRLLYPNRGADTGSERWLIIRDEQPLENIQIGGYRFAVNILIINRLDIAH